MKVLWISNVLFPEVCKELKLPTPSVGGWMHSGAYGLIDSANGGIKLAVAAFYKGDKVLKIDKYKICYYLLPIKKAKVSGSETLINYYKELKNDFNPDIIHIHGSEYPHSLAYIKACGNQNVIVSIQGLVSVYSKYYLGGIELKTIKKNITIRDVLRNDTLLKQQKEMTLRGNNEVELIKSVNHIIGRTSWDKSHSWAINSNAKYHFCNETLRKPFYNGNWRYEGCEKFSIFLSQGHYPIKGLHQVIKAINIVKKHFPEVKVYIAGHDFFSGKGMKINGYAKIIMRLLKQYTLLDNFKYLGVLNEEEMKEQFLKANVFICPSAIENSPNSIGEAQLLGVPCLASYVGGNMDFIESGESGFLYRFEEFEMLANQVCTLFTNEEMAKGFGAEGRKKALIRHDGNANANNMLRIYKDILNAV